MEPISLFLLTGLVAALAGEGETPRLLCPLLPPKIRVDGLVEAAEWERASAMSGLVRLGEERVEDGLTTFWVAADGEALYVAVRMPLPPKAKPKAGVAQHDGPVWEDDAVEVFLDPGRSRRDYFQFIGNSVGTKWESRGQDGSWDAPWDFRATVHEGRWEAELRLPFASLGVPPPQPGEVWGFNLCCDRQTPWRELLSWAPLQKGFHEPQRFGELVFERGASRVQLLLEGRPSGGRVRLTGRAFLETAPLQMRLTVQQEGRKLAESQTLTGPGQEAVVRWEGGPPKAPLAPGLYRVAFEVLAQEREPRLLTKVALPLRVEPPLVLTLHPFYLVAKRLQVDVAVKGMEVPLEELALRLEVRRAEDGKEVGGQWVERIPDTAQATVEFDTTDWPAGKYALVARAFRRGEDEPLAEERQPFEKPPTPKWLGSQAGMTEEVLPPWTPIEVEGTTIKPWGREYVYADRPFPKAIVTRKEQVLAGPMRLLVRYANRTMEVEGGTFRLLRRSPGVVEWAYEATMPSFRLEEKVTIEYDGMIRHDWRLIPIGSPTLEGLVVEIPLQAEHARYLYHFPGRWGSAFNAGALPKEGFVSAFRPFLWLGDEDRGLAWFAESDRNWFPADPNRAVEILPQGEVVLLRLNLIGQPLTLTEPLDYTFGLQATPVKAVAEDVWDMRIVHAGRYGLESQPYRGPATLTYPAEGNFPPQQGTLELWVQPAFDPQVEVDPSVPRGTYNRDLFAVRWPDGDMLMLYWNIDDRGLRFFIKRGEGYPLLFGTHQKWRPGEWHHVALTWGEAVRIYVDGELAAERAWRGTLDKPLQEAQLIFGGGACEFAIDEIRLSDVPRTTFDLTAPPQADEHTLLLDPLDESFTPDGQRRTQGGGVPAGLASFKPGRFGNGLFLYRPSGPKTYLDHLAELGVRTLVFHEHWTDIQNYTSTTHGEALRRLVRACHERGIRLLLYFGYEMSDIAPEYPFYGEECLVFPRAGGYMRQPPQTAYIVCYRSPWQDFLAEGITRMMDEYDIDGVYLDGTEYPFACRNQRHGCGYRRPDGSTAPTYPFFAVRRLMQRIYAIVKTRKPNGLVNVHNSTCMTIPTLAWATSTWDGEQFGSLQPGPFALEVLPLDAFRCEFMGRQWGVPAEFLCYNRPYTYPQALGFTLLHDVLVRGLSPEQIEHESRLWRAMERFGRKQALFLPYWNNAEVVQVNPSEVKVSLWSRGEEGTMLVVSNLGRERCQAEVSLNLPRLRLPPTALARDALTGEPLPLERGSLTLGLEPLEWRLVEVKGPGKD